MNKNESVASLERCLESSDNFLVPSKLLPKCLCGASKIKFTQYTGDNRENVILQCAVCNRLIGIVIPAQLACKCSCSEIMIVLKPQPQVREAIRQASFRCCQCERFFKS